MKDEEKFLGLKERAIRENEEKYGREVRERYGDEAADASNARLSAMTQDGWRAQEELSLRVIDALKAAMQTGDPAGPRAREACVLHRQWLCLFWQDGAYSKESHRAMGEMYVADPRFAAYYNERAGEGAAVFLRDALNEYTK
jgi:hypothetical protein